MQYMRNIADAINRRDENKRYYRNRERRRAAWSSLSLATVVAGAIFVRLASGITHLSRSRNSHTYALYSNGPVVESLANQLQHDPNRILPARPAGNPGVTPIRIIESPERKTVPRAATILLSQHCHPRCLLFRITGTPRRQHPFDPIRSDPFP